MFKNLFLIIFKNMFFVMSLSGTVVFILYLCIYPLLERYLSLKWRYKILKISMLFFLVPFPLGKYYVWGFFYDHISFIKEIANRYESKIMNPAYIIVANPDLILLSPKVQLIYLMVSFIVLISSFILWKEMIQYRKMKQLCVANLVNLKGSTEQSLQNLFSNKKEMLNIRKNVTFICSEYCKSPITIGVLSPVVLFPIWDNGKKIDEELYEYMMTHELVHIKHNDILIKLTALFVIAIHWFNPFVYLLIAEVSCISEMYCDSVVMDGKGKEERNKYGNLLLRLIVEDVSFDKKRFGVGFANLGKKKMYKRRILEMKERKKYNRLVSVIITTFICVAGGITAFAHQPPSTIVNETNKVVGTDMYILYESLLPEKLLSDCFDASGDEMIYDFCDADENTKAICNHDYSIPVKVADHAKDGNGGCVVNVYSALECKKCKDKKLVDLWSTTTYKSCPH